MGGGGFLGGRGCWGGGVLGGRWGGGRGGRGCGEGGGEGGGEGRRRRRRRKRKRIGLGEGLLLCGGNLGERFYRGGAGFVVGAGDLVLGGGLFVRELRPIFCVGLGLRVYGCGSVGVRLLTSLFQPPLLPRGCLVV